MRQFLRSGAALAFVGWSLLFAGTALAAGAVYEDVAEEVGIHFLHPGEDEPFFYSVTGGGSCLGDFDGDGFPDAYLVADRYRTPSLQALLDPRSKLYRNLGDGTFEDVTAGSGSDVRGWFQGCAAADYDADGDLDLYVSGYGTGALLRNDGPFRFTNVTASAGVSSQGVCGAKFPCWGTGASWTDTNADGCLDLYIVNYVEYIEEEHEGNGPAFYVGQRNNYFESRCDGTFVEMAEARNLDDDPGPERSKSFAPMWADFDSDGDFDVYITSDGTPNSLLRNNGDGTFTDVGREYFVDDPRAGMGLEFDDVDGDGDPDLYMTHYEHENNGFYRNEAKSGYFEDVSTGGDLEDVKDYVGWGTAFFDWDHDGRKDIFVVNGHTQMDSKHVDQRRFVFRQDEDGVFRNVSSLAGAAIDRRTNGRGLSLCDYDFDGDLDAVIVNNHNQTANVLRAGGDAPANWLQIQLRQPGGNREAIGARMKVTAEGLPTATVLARTGASYLGSHCPTWHFGLADAQRVRVEVLWPDGVVEAWTDVPANRVVRLTRGDPEIETDTLAPVTVLTTDGELRGGWYGKPVTITFAAYDLAVNDVPSGGAGVDFRIGGGAWNAYEVPFVLGNGIHNLEFRAHDHAGNREPVRSTVIRVDLVPPTTSLALEGTRGNDPWFVTAPDAVLSATDAESGVESIHFRLDDGEKETYVGPVSLGDGIRSLAYHAIDVAGNEEPPASATVHVDTVPPVTDLRVEGPVLFEGGRFVATSETVFLPGPSDAVSGVAGSEYRINGGTWLDFRKGARLSGEDGERGLEYRSFDFAGNVEPGRRIRVLLDDATPPRLAVVSPREGRVYAGDLDAPLAGALPGSLVATLRSLGLDRPAWVVGSVRVQAEAGPDVSGVVETRVLLDGALAHATAGGHLDWTWDPGVGHTGDHEVRIEAEDGRGNVAVATVRVRVLG